MPREDISDQLRNQVLERDGNCCRYCGNIKPPFHIDHVYPASKEGETTINNLVTACQKCNLKKHNKVGIWPKPIGYFDKSHPRPLAGLLCMYCIILINLGAGIMLFGNSSRGFNILMFGLVLGFVGVHLKKETPHED